jgi:hypothetical protein
MRNKIVTDYCSSNVISMHALNYDPRRRERGKPSDQHANHEGIIPMTCTSKQENQQANDPREVDKKKKEQKTIQFISVNHFIHVTLEAKKR